MSRASKSVPSYRLHRASGQAVVTVRGLDGQRRDIYLGVYDSTESRAEYARILAELASGSPKALAPADRLTVDELLLKFLEHADRHYRRPDGTPTGRLESLKYAAKPLHLLYGHTPAADFGPLALRAVRQVYVNAGNSRSTANHRTGMVRQIFRWAVSHELIPPGVHTALATVRGLEPGRTEARETQPVGPVSEADVAAVLPLLNSQVRGLVEFQRLTGCRPGEVMALRPCDIDRTGDVWHYRPAQHKTRHRGKHRDIPIGPKAQALLAPYLASVNSGGYVFSPRTVRGAKANARYTRFSYWAAIKRACLKAGVTPWAPNRLRHTFATMVRRDHGLEAAQVLLGHSKADVTQVYAEANLRLAASVAAKIG